MNSLDFNSYISLISKFSDNDDPNLFCLPSNVDRSVQRYVSNQVLTRLNGMYTLNISYGSSSSNKFDKNFTQERLNPLLIFWKSQYNQDSIEIISRLIFKINSDDPINIFIKSQATQIFELGKSVNKTFTDILSVLESNQAITSSIMNDCMCLLQSKIPENWLSYWDGPELPFNFIKSLIKKLNSISCSYSTVTCFRALNLVPKEEKSLNQN